MARRRFDADAGDARHTRRGRSHGLRRGLLPGLPGRPCARPPQRHRLPGDPGGGGAGELRPLRPRRRRPLRARVLRRDAAGAGRRAVVGRAARRRHLRGDATRAAGALPGSRARRVPDRGRLRRDGQGGLPTGGRGVPGRARNRRPDRDGRLDVRALAPQRRARTRRRAPPPPVPPPAGHTRPAARHGVLRVPTGRERELEHELAVLRERPAAPGPWWRRLAGRRR